MLREVSRQNIFFAINDALNKGYIVLIACQGHKTSKGIEGQNVPEAVFASESRTGIFTHEPHEELLLAAHGVISDVLQPVSHLLAVHPPRLVHHLDNPLVHKSSSFIKFVFAKCTS